MFLMHVLAALLMVATQKTQNSMTTFEDLVRKHADQQTNTITLLESNSGFHSMLHTWLYHAKKVGALKSYIVVALDLEEYNRLVEAGVVTYYDMRRNTSHFDTRAQLFRSEAYNKIVFHKWIIALKALAIGVNVLITDIDVVWLQNPLPRLAHYVPNCSILASSDDPLHTKNPTWVNTGFMYLRATEQTVAFLKLFVRWCKGRQSEMQGKDDQYKWQMFTEKGMSTMRPVAAIDRRCITYSNGATKLDLFVLPLVKYMDFRHWNEATRHQKSKAITLHYNWLNGLAEKKGNMKRMGHWVEKKHQYG